MTKSAIWTVRNKGKSPAVTVSELYERVEGFVQSLREDPTDFSSLAHQSDLLLEALPRLLNSVSEKPRMLQAQNLTLEALGLGMVMGACDGFLLFQEDTLPAPAELQFQDKELHRLAQVLAKNLSEICLVAQKDWKSTHPDDLHLLCGYGKQQNLKSLEEGGQLATHSETSLRGFQKFLLASVKGGYAMGVAEVCLSYFGK